MSTTLFLDDREVELLRSILDRAVLPIADLGFVSELLQRLPESSASPVGSADSSPSAGGQAPTGAGFRLKACTPRAVPMVEALDRVLARIPHGESL